MGAAAATGGPTGTGSLRLLGCLCGRVSPAPASNSGRPAIAAGTEAEAAAEAKAGTEAGAEVGAEGGGEGGGEGGAAAATGAGGGASRAGGWALTKSIQRY